MSYFSYFHEFSVWLFWILSPSYPTLKGRWLRLNPALLHMFSPSFELIVSVWQPVDIHCTTERTRTLPDSRGRPLPAGNAPIDILNSNCPAPTSSKQNDRVAAWHSQTCRCRRDFFFGRCWWEPTQGFMWPKQPVHTSVMVTWSVAVHLLASPVEVPLVVQQYNEWE